jgi:putative DNA primase/helicase
MGKLIPLYRSEMPLIRRDMGDVMNVEYSERTQFWGPAFVKSSLVMVYAPRGVGKTFFVLKLSHALATGSQFLKWEGPRKRLKVIIFDGEMGDQGIASRMHMIEGSSPNSMDFRSVFLVNYKDCGGEMWNLSSPKDQDLYEREIEGCDVVVIDNLLTCSRAMGNRDEEFSQWTRVQPFLIRLREAGKMVVLVHHAGKATDRGSYGTSLKENIMDTIVGLKPMPNDSGFELRWEKLRNTPSSECPNLYVNMQTDSLQNLTWDWCSLEDRLRQQVLTMHACGTKPREIAEILQVSRSRVAKMISDYAPKETSDGEPKGSQMAWHQRVLEENDDSEPF